MNTQIEIKELQQFLYKELLRLSLVIDDSFHQPQVKGYMSSLVRKAKQWVNAETEEQRINQLLALVYNEWKFNCSPYNYFDTRNILVNKVLRDKQGMPVSLGAVVLYLASVLSLPIYPVNFPIQLILRAEYINDNNQPKTRFINPWNGQDISLAQLEKRLEGELGFEATLSPEFIRVANMEELLERVETVVKMILTREGNYEKALEIIENRLTFSPDDPYEIRDRGMVLASLDCFDAAAKDLNYFIEKCPDDPSALMLKLEVPTLLKQSKDYQIH